MCAHMCVCLCACAGACELATLHVVARVYAHVHVHAHLFSHQDCCIICVWVLRFRRNITCFRMRIVVCSMLDANDVALLNP